jgi:catechol 2,3-dioxygenase-like lactoylglutathione lyase family enzyme
VSGGLRLARGKFDVGLLTGQPELMLSFWSEQLGLPVERTFEPTPGIVQHKLTMHGAVLKLNCVEGGLPSRTERRGMQLLRLVSALIDEPRHLVDPDGNAVHLFPPGHQLRTFAAHLAVSDEDAADRFYGSVLGLERIGERTFDVAGADLSFERTPAQAEGAAGAGYGYLTLQVMDVHEAHALLCGRGASELQPPSDTAFAGGSSVSFVTDPDGNVIELSQRPDLVAAAT